MQSVERLTAEADGYFNAGRYRKAERLYRKTLTGQKTDSQPWIMMGLCRHHRQDAEGALACFRQAVGADDNQPMAHYHLGRHCLDLGQLDQGREALAQAVALNPNHVQARTLFGYSFILGRDYARAINELKIARRAGPRYGPAATMLALAQMEAGELEEAAKQANVAVQLEPDNPGAQSIMGRVLLARGSVHFAAQCFRNALDKQPDNPELHAGLGRALRQGGDPAQALMHLETALQSGLRTPDIGVEYARALAGTGRVADALRVVESLPEKMLDTDTRVLMVELKLAGGDYPGARQALERLPGEAPEKPLLSARLALGENDRERALEQLSALYDHTDAGIADRARMLAAETHLAADEPELAHRAIEPLLAADRPDWRALNLWIGHLQGQQQWDELANLLEPLAARADFGEVAQQRAACLLVEALDAAGQYERAAAHLPAAAWREPEFLHFDRSESAQRARAALKQAPDALWQGLAGAEPVPEFSGVKPVFMLGWPGSGIGELAAVLAAHPGVQVLAMENANQRVRILGELCSLDGPAITPEQLDAARRQYLAPQPDAAVALDPVSYETALLPGIARLFPGAQVVVLSAPEADLKLHWMLGGYRRVDEIVDAYRAERDLFQHIAAKLSLEIVSIARHRLQNDTEATLAELCQRLGLDRAPAMVDDFRARAAGLRADGHWKHYENLISAAAVTESS